MGLPVYLSQRGINLPGLSFAIVAHFVLVFICGGGGRDYYLGAVGDAGAAAGKSINRTFWAGLAFVLVLATGWFVATPFPAARRFWWWSRCPSPRLPMFQE
ncbi:MAG: hypothetical protein M5U34_36800 [Chloroflexi bacterium]|nr:hypothetical protein [Chloroflexota bacterium]